MAATRPYRWLAEHYDIVFGDHYSLPWLAHEVILEPLLPQVRSACDLACGTGNTAIGLAKRGIRMFGVDLSPGMCRVTRRKAREAGVPVRVIQADMRTFELPQQVDLVICEFDAVNHVPRQSDLTKVARAVWRALAPGGYFFFDVNNLIGFAKYWHGTWWIEKPGIVLVMRNDHDFLRRKAWADCEWFLQEGRLWRRHSERVEEICWTDREIRSALRAAGFGKVQMWDSSPFFPDNPLITPGCRSHYLARKKA